MAPPKRGGGHVDCVKLKAVLLVLDRGGTSKEYGVVRRKVCSRGSSITVGRSSSSSTSSRGSDNDRSKSSEGGSNKNVAPCCACGEAKYEVLCVVCFTALIIIINAASC